MLYHLLYEFLYPMSAYLSPLKAFNVIQYVTFRTAYASLTALLIGLLLGPWLIKRLQEFQMDSTSVRRAQSLTRPRRELRRWAVFSFWSR